MIKVRFQLAVQAVASRIADHPLGGAPSCMQTRSAGVKGFPFTVVYRALANEVLSVAIAPHRKRPNYWASRVE